MNACGTKLVRQRQLEEKFTMEGNKGNITMMQTMKKNGDGIMVGMQNMTTNADSMMTAYEEESKDDDNNNTAVIVGSIVGILLAIIVLVIAIRYFHSKPVEGILSEKESQVSESSSASNDDEEEMEDIKVENI